MSDECHGAKRSSRGAPVFRSAGSLPAAGTAANDPVCFASAARPEGALRPGRPRSTGCRIAVQDSLSGNRPCARRESDSKRHEFHPVRKL